MFLYKILFKEHFVVGWLDALSDEIWHVVDMTLWV